jgi:serine/threonine protein kinase
VASKQDVDNSNNNDDADDRKKLRKEAVPLLPPSSEVEGAKVIEVLEAYKDRKNNKLLGTGAHGTVFQVNIPGTDEKYALKMLFRDGDEKNKKQVDEVFEKEVTALKEFKDGCNKNHILCFVDSLKSKNEDYILTKFKSHYISLHELMEKIRADPDPLENVIHEEAARRFINTLVASLLFIEQHGWAHNDIHHNNVRVQVSSSITTGMVQLIDLGLTRPEGAPFYSLFTLDFDGIPDMAHYSTYQNDRKRAKQLVYPFVDDLYWKYSSKDKAGFWSTIPQSVKDYLEGKDLLAKGVNRE